MALRVLFDGWPLVNAPLSAAAWHMRTLIALNPDGVQVVLALPTEDGAQPALAGIEAGFHHTHDRAAWEQQLLPRLAIAHRANIIHTTSVAASLLGRIPTIVSPAETEAADRGRLGEAMGRGGLTRATIVWPDDLAKTNPFGKVRALPRVVHPEFTAGNVYRLSNDLPDEFILVQGDYTDKEIVELLESWTWAAASIGELYPLVFVELDPEKRAFIEARLPEFHVQESVRLLSNVQPQEMPNILRACSAVVFLGDPAPWGNGLRHALASGKAIVAHQNENTESIVGSAGYLTAPTDLRSFGAAMITVVVDEKAREKLEASALERAALWPAGKFKDELVKIYNEKN